MYERLNRPTSGKKNITPPKPAQSQASRSRDGLPAGLRLLDDSRHEIALGEILAALSAQPAEQPLPDARLREVEDAIRRHWAVLRNLVREHAELSHARHLSQGPMDAPKGPAPLPKVAIFTPPQRVVAAE